MKYAGQRLVPALLAVFVAILALAMPAFADGEWRVGKVSGEVWFTVPGVQTVALGGDAVLKPGDTVRTGQDGRVLLLRGAQSILVSPNSTISLSEDATAARTTVLQQAGSILVEVDKRGHQHFEVATPHLAAVVKGTRFDVVVDDFGSRVGVEQGEVEVTDYTSGQGVVLKRDQQARVSLQGPGGLVLGGTGKMNPIRQGAPRNSPVRMTVGIGLRASIPAVSDGVRVAASQEAHPSPAAQTSSSPDKQPRKEPGMTSVLFSWKGDSGGRKQAFGRDDIAMAAVPAIVGLSVAVGVTAVRWRRRRNEKKQQKAGK